MLKNRTFYPTLGAQLEDKFWNFQASVIGGALSLILNLILIPLYNIEGATYSYFFSSLICLAVLLYNIPTIFNEFFDLFIIYSSLTSILLILKFNQNGLLLCLIFVAFVVTNIFK